jgi:hypothetical protein
MTFMSLNPILNEQKETGRKKKKLAVQFEICSERTEEDKKKRDENV